MVFESCPWPRFPKEWNCFRIGTCEGLWRATKNSYQILAITNNEPGNGHFNDVLEWFQYSCNRDKKHFVILELWNERLSKHLIEKRGFDVWNNSEGYHVIKPYQSHSMKIKSLVLK